MHKNHVYNLVAKVLRENKPLIHNDAHWFMITSAFAAKFQEDDPDFDSQKFFRQCLGAK